MAKQIKVGDTVRLAEPVSTTEAARVKKAPADTYHVERIEGNHAVCGGWWFNISALETCEPNQNPKHHWDENDDHLAKFGLRRA